jgi:CDP-glucose 4,6-dehydratase
MIGWHPQWHLERAIAETVEWYLRWTDGDDMLAFSRGQIDRYREGVEH